MIVVCVPPFIILQFKQFCERSIMKATLFFIQVDDTEDDDDIAGILGILAS